MLAVRKNNLKMVKFLVKSGAEVDAQNNQFITALMIAISRNNLEMVKFLMESGANIYAEDIDGRIALSYAQHPEIIEFLLSETTDKNLKEAINKTVKFNTESLLCILPKSNISSVNKNFREIIKNNILNLIGLVQSEESKIRREIFPNMENYIRRLMALANLAVFNIFDPIDKEKTESFIKSAVADSTFIHDLFIFYCKTCPNTAIKMCCIDFLMILTKLGFFNISDATTTTETTKTEENGAETIVQEILKIKFEHKEVGVITVSVEPALREYVLDFLKRLNSPKRPLSALTNLAKNVIKENKPIYDKRHSLPESLQRYIEQKPSLQEIIKNIEILRDNASASL